jgi:hypothetical protein
LNFIHIIRFEKSYEPLVFKWVFLTDFEREIYTKVLKFNGKSLSTYLKDDSQYEHNKVKIWKKK